ncbi:hypothetical protein CAC42_2490 [Sphaceloma murrayae]|uniref:tRNA/rRNA methyltransferase SpoU type domain-containing protein n=1 Tax=Sphaceloma murrayae TaxID=2082308 RepID=A0A2K1QWN9_9PEZI|nr:hypothetical protein CAC42_2490 [Sphaceloma murrayae]
MARLLEESVLPWATRGPLFTASIRGERNALTCEHGQNLSIFICRLLVEEDSHVDLSTQKLFLSTILKYLARERHHIVSYAPVYILQGICWATKGWRQHSLDDEAIAALLDITSSPGVPDVVRDLLIVQGTEICKIVAPGKSNLAIQKKLQVLRDACDRLIDSTARGVSLRWPTLVSIQDDIQASRSLCLKGLGLLDACVSLQNALDDPTATMDPKILSKVLDAIWEQVEIDDYPKFALLRVPGLFLHVRCVQLALIDDDVRSILLSFLEAYRLLPSGRIYTWSPLMIAVRQAIFEVPEFKLVVDINTIVMDVVKGPPSAKAEFRLDAAAAIILSTFRPETAGLTYEHYYGSKEGVGWAAFFDLLNHVGATDTAMAQSLLDTLLEPWMKQRIPAVIVNRWKTTEWVQAMLIIMNCKSVTDGYGSAQAYMKQFMYLLSVEPLPRYRFLFEWILCRIIIGHEKLMEPVLEVLSSIDHHSNPKYLASIIKVAVQVVCSEHGSEADAAEVMNRLTGLAASSKIIIRHEAQWALPGLWKHCQVSGWLSIVENPALIGLMEYMHSLYRTIEPAPERENSRLSLDTDQTMATLLCGSYLGLEPSTKPQLELEDYEQLLKLDEQGGRKKPNTEYASLPWGKQPRARVHATYSNVKQEDKPGKIDIVVPLQTKGTSYLSGTISDIKTKRHNSSLLVVGSLVDNPYNIGGLSRVSEIFGAAALYVASTKVLAHKDFESVAVSSHTHFDVRELAVADMVDFIVKMRLEGYTIVGIEQTDRSQILGREATRLPRKTILILGAEREGMPATVLAECDMLVEIPQKGSTRSLNVQTAASCVLFDYCRQHG